MTPTKLPAILGIKRTQRSISLFGRYHSLWLPDISQRSSNIRLIFYLPILPCLCLIEKAVFSIKLYRVRHLPFHTSGYPGIYKKKSTKCNIGEKSCRVIFFPIKLQLLNFQKLIKSCVLLLLPRISTWKILSFNPCVRTIKGMYNGLPIQS